MVEFKREKAESQPIIYLYAGKKLLTNRVSIIIVWYLEKHQFQREVVYFQV